MSWNFKLVDGPYGGTTEGPVWDGSGLLFTHIPASRIMRYNPKTKNSTAYHNFINLLSHQILLTPLHRLSYTISR